MKCEVEVTSMWVTFNIDEEVIIEFNKSHGIPENLQSSFKIASALGFDAFEYADGDWEFSESSLMYAYKNQSGECWSEFDDEENNITDEVVKETITKK